METPSAPSTPSQVTAEPLAVDRPDQHAYVSTACQHGLHDRCRMDCKFCGATCRCECHHGHTAG